ncbi:hypothetical protein DD582_32585, partial [Klebsiella pneumoniae]
LQVDGGLKTGLDIIKAAILGAESFGFGTGPMVAGSASSRASPASQRRRRIVDAVIGSVYRSALGGQPLQVFGQAGRGFDREQLREFVGMQLAQAFLQGGGHCCK